ncbi:putative cytochrome c oxidase subunit 1 [Chlamydia psittaci 03DC29]|nr:putative cytochrome c oxidase subunit 1 [Chlamydia psittaci 02DC22]EPJ26164.1 putative cytochrome c oxidase subunit 1 [Chlamydia psittaci 03DC29]
MPLAAGKRGEEVRSLYYLDGGMLCQEHQLSGVLVSSRTLQL